MLKVLGFLSKKASLTMRDFIDYYENRHVPLILRLAPPPIVYKRRYLRHDEKQTNDGGVVDFDVVTELGFSDRASFASWMEHLSAPSAGEQVAADEAKFLDHAPAPTLSRST